MKSSIAIRMAAGMLTDVISDMVTKEGVTNFRETIINSANNLADKTNTQLDDNIVDFLVDKAFTPENYSEYGVYLMESIMLYVENSETKYDNFLLPVLRTVAESFESAGQ